MSVRYLKLVINLPTVLISLDHTHALVWMDSVALVHLVIAWVGFAIMQLFAFMYEKFLIGIPPEVNILFQDEYVVFDNGELSIILEPYRPLNVTCESQGQHSGDVRWTLSGEWEI